jgi:predicted tellurium resistance membrane protein TerC
LDWLTNLDIWASLLTLTVLEIVLGVDNLVFIAVLAGRLPKAQQAAARRTGLAVALLTRLALLASIAWVMGLHQAVFEIAGKPISWRDLILIVGGVFLLYKATAEIHHRMDPDAAAHDAASAAASFAGIVAQIAVLDIVFSLDSVITAVGMANDLWVMATAIVIAMIVMLVAAGPLTEFLERRPTVKMLAFCFLFMIGAMLVADGAGFHVPKGYIYGAIAFSILVEALNQLAARRTRRP